jgi:hypothetical protein
MMTNIGIFIASLLLLIFIPFGSMWYDHTGFVQAMVQEDIAKYQEDVPDWVDLQNSDPAQVNRLAISAVSNMNFVMSGSWQRDESYEYRDSLHDVMAATRSSDASNLNEALQVSARKYEEWIAANTYFVENRLYAMRYTF